MWITTGNLFLWDQAALDLGEYARGEEKKKHVPSIGFDALPPIPSPLSEKCENLGKFWGTLGPL